MKQYIKELIDAVIAKRGYRYELVIRRCGGIIILRKNLNFFEAQDLYTNERGKGNWNSLTVTSIRNKKRTVINKISF